MKRLLIVEDDSGMQEIYRDIFGEAEDRYAYEIVGSAEQGLKRLGESGFDLIILDIIMQPLAGDSFFVYVRENLKLRHVPIIVVSVLDPQLLENLKTMKNVGFLQKPIARARLIEKIREMTPEDKEST
jgi:CheY-like chemotaxis protein